MKRGQRRRGEAMEDDRSWGGKRRWQMKLQKTREAVKEEKAMEEDRGCGSGERDGGRVEEGKD